MSEKADIRLLRRGDEALLRQFLLAHAQSSLLLLGNLSAVGIEYQGATYQAHYVGGFEAGALVAVAAHAWNGVLLLQAPMHAADVAREALRVSERSLSGVLGPWVQVQAVLHGLSLEREATTVCQREVLFELPLARLTLPQLLAQRTARVERPRVEHLSQLVQWRHDFSVEALSEPPSETLLTKARESVERHHREGRLFALLEGQTLVSTCAFNVQVDGVAQLGAVYTPPAHRGRGAGRAVVAGALQLAQLEGVTTGVLFTGDANEPAQRAYRAIGFEAIGDYGMVFFAREVTTHFSTGGM